MPPRPFVNDALWRCLCPGFPSNARLLPRATVVAHKATQPAQLNTRSQSRAYNTASATPPSEPVFSNYNDPFSNHNNPPNPPGRGKSTGNRAQARARAKVVSLARQPTSILYELLRTEGESGDYDGVMHVVNVLIRDRGERPNKDMYAAILHSFVSSENGTAGKVRKVLEEMGFWEDGEGSLGAQDKIDLDHRGCECVLEALAVHPDYLLRSDILNYMKARWFALSDRAQNFVVAGLLRDRLFEQALEMLDDMARKHVKIESWLFDKTLWTLLEFGEIEEAFDVLNLRQSVQVRETSLNYKKMSPALLGALLDAAGRVQLHDPAKRLWMSQVQNGYIKPPTATCVAVLSIAARHGDVPLATDVFRLLTERRIVFTTHHYELLIEAHLKAGDLSAAVTVILIMVQAGLKVTSETCHPLYWYLRNEKPGSPSLPLAAFTLFQDSEATGRKVPTAAVNACIQASIALGRLEEAIEIYKALHSVSLTGPNTQTFNILFQGCKKASRKDLAMFLASEMIQLNLRPDRITYDRLIIVCLHAGDTDDALAYYEEMRELGMQPRRGTYEWLITQTAEKGDERCVSLLKDFKATGDGVTRAVWSAVHERFVEKKKSEGESVVV